MPHRPVTSRRAARRLWSAPPSINTRQPALYRASRRESLVTFRETRGITSVNSVAVANLQQANPRVVTRPFLTGPRVKQLVRRKEVRKVLPIFIDDLAETVAVQAQHPLPAARSEVRSSPSLSWGRSARPPSRFSRPASLWERPRIFHAPAGQTWLGFWPRCSTDYSRHSAAVGGHEVSADLCRSRARAGGRHAHAGHAALLVTLAGARRRAPRDADPRQEHQTPTKSDWWPQRDPSELTEFKCAISLRADQLNAELFVAVLV